MTPKEKAKELIEKFSFSNRYNLEKDGYFYNIYAAKESAHICVNEMLDFRNNIYINENSLAHQYLIEVKQEIDNL